MAIPVTFNHYNGSNTTEEEMNAYRDKVKELNGGTLDDVTSISVTFEDGDNVKLEWETKDETKIERIRRITG